MDRTLNNLGAFAAPTDCAMRTLPRELVECYIRPMVVRPPPPPPPADWMPRPCLYKAVHTCYRCGRYNAANTYWKEKCRKCQWEHWVCVQSYGCVAGAVCIWCRADQA